MPQQHKLACWIYTQAHWCNCPYGQWYANGGDKPQTKSATADGKREVKWTGTSS